MAEHLKDTENPFFRRWAEFVLGHKALCLVLVLLVTAAGSIYQIKNHLRTDFDIESFLASKSETRKSLDAFRDIFGRDDRFLVMVEGDVFSMRYLETLKKLHEELGLIDLELASVGKLRASPKRRARRSSPPKRPPRAPLRTTTSVTSKTMTSVTLKTQETTKTSGLSSRVAPSSRRSPRSSTCGRPEAER